MKKNSTGKPPCKARSRAVVAYQIDAFGRPEKAFADKGRKINKPCRVVKPRRHVASPLQLSLALELAGWNIKVQLTNATTDQDLKFSINSTDKEGQ